MNDDNVRRRFFRCECYGEGLAVEHHTTTHDCDNEVLVSFWQMGRRHHTTLGMRIRHILRVIRDGHPYGDMVILSPERARELGQYLVEVSDKDSDSERKD